MKFSLRALSLLALPIAAHALTSSDASLVFGTVNSGVSGTTTTTDFGQLTVLLNGTHALVSLNATSTPLGQVGWMAVGWGTGMSNADIVVAWPTANAGWTLSHRSSSGHVSPRALSDTSSAYSLVPALSTVESNATAWSTVSFLRPLNLSSEAGYSLSGSSSKYSTLSAEKNQKIIWAAGSKNPGQSDAGSPIEFHDLGQGTLSMDLSPAFSTSSSSSSSSSGDSSVPQTTDASVSAPWTKRDSIIVAHAIFGVLAWLIFAPLGALIGRFARRSASWVPWHQGVQLGGTGICTIITVALGIAGTQIGGGDHWVGSHKQIGLALVILMMLQIALGEVNHLVFQRWQRKNALLPVPETRVRPWNNYLHIVLGITLLILGYSQIRLGLALYSRTPKGLVILFWIVLGFQVAAYTHGSFLPLLRSRSSTSDHADARASTASSHPSNEKTIVQFPGANRTISDMGLPKIPQSRGFLPTHAQQQQQAGPYATTYPLNRQPSLGKLQSNLGTPAGAPVGPSPRDFARPPYGFGSAPMVTPTSNMMATPLVRKSSRTAFSVPISDSPRYVHRAESVSSHGSDNGIGKEGGGYWTPPEVQKIELAGDWVKKSSGVQRERGHGRKESLKRRSVSSTTTGSLSTSGHGHGF